MAQRIKVCQVINAYAVGGAETVALDIARSLDPGRFESLVLAAIQRAGATEPPMLRSFREAEVASYALPARSFRDPRAHWALWRFFRQHRPDIVHGHNRFSDLWAGRAARTAGVAHVLWTRHSVYADMASHQLARYQALAQHVPVVLAVSDAVGEHCVATEGIPAAKVRTVANGIDLDRFRPLTAEQRRLKREELGVGESDWLLLFVGRLVPDKVPGAFVALVHALRQRGLPVRGFIAGRGPLAPDLEPGAAAAGVRLLGLRTDVPELLGACDLLVSTSCVEGLPLNVMEAMAAGAAFVGPDLAQIQQLVASDRELAGGLFARPPRGVEVPGPLVEQWADVVAERLGDRERLARWGQRGRAIIAERFSLEQMVRRHEEIYAAIVAGKL